MLSPQILDPPDLAMSLLMILCCFKVLPGGIESTKISGNHLGFVCLRWFFLRIAIPINVFQFFSPSSPSICWIICWRIFFSIRIEESQNPRLVGLNVSIGRLDFFLMFHPLDFFFKGNHKQIWPAAFDVWVQGFESSHVKFVPCLHGDVLRHGFLLRNTTPATIGSLTWHSEKSKHEWK